PEQGPPAPWCAYSGGTRGRSILAQDFGDAVHLDLDGDGGVGANSLFAVCCQRHPTPPHNPPASGGYLAVLVRWTRFLLGPRSTVRMRHGTARTLVLSALLVAGCRAAANTPRGTAERFLDAHYVRIDLPAGLEFTADLARHKVEDELRLVQGQVIDETTRKPSVHYRLLEEHPDGTEAVRYLYRGSITIEDADRLERRWLVTVRLADGAWRVTNYEEFEGWGGAGGSRSWRRAWPWSWWWRSPRSPTTPRRTRIGCSPRWGRGSDASSRPSASASPSAAGRASRSRASRSRRSPRWGRGSPSSRRARSSSGCSSCRSCAAGWSSIASSSRRRW